MNLKILYEDNHILVLNKPAGLLTQPTNSESLETIAKAFIKERDHKPGNVFLHAVHRLDKQASGIVIFAKTQKALSRLSKSLREHSCHKQYTALVQGPSPPKKGQLIDYIIHKSHRAQIVSPSYPKAQRAELNITSTKKIAPNQWCLTITLITGRYHQIRAQLAAHHFPILGDTKYGSSTPFSPHAIALHHSLISFPHPTQNRVCEIQSSPAW